jgi:isoleucyl-tRNA synthetase
LQDEGIEFKFTAGETIKSDNVMDKWILSYTQTLIAFVDQEMAAYRLYTVVPRLLQFIENLTNWYVRFNRKRLKGANGTAECLASMKTLFEVLFTMARLLSPFTPFLAENFYQHLRRFMTGETEDSVHFVMAPTVNAEYSQPAIEKAVARMQAVIDLARTVRSRKVLAVKYPLSELVVVSTNQEALDDVQRLGSYVEDEVNVKALTLSTDQSKYGVSLRADPDLRRLGERFRSEMKPILDALRKLTAEQLTELRASGRIVVNGQELTSEDVSVLPEISADARTIYEPAVSGEFLVLLDVRPSEEMIAEGLAREFVNRVQKLRKKVR